MDTVYMASWPWVFVASISNMPGLSPLHFCKSWPFQKPKAGLFSQKNDVMASWSSNLNAWTAATSEACVALLHPCKKKDILYIPVARCRSNASLGLEEHGVFCYEKKYLEIRWIGCLFGPLRNMHGLCILTNIHQVTKLPPLSLNYQNKKPTSQAGKKKKAPNLSSFNNTNSQGKHHPSFYPLQFLHPKSGSKIFEISSLGTFKLLGLDTAQFLMTTNTRTCHNKSNGIQEISMVSAGEIVWRNVGEVFLS